MLQSKKFGMTAIMGFLIGLLNIFGRNGYLTMLTGLAGGLIADIILKRQITKFKECCFILWRFSIWVFGNFAPIS